MTRNRWRRIPIGLALLVALPGCDSILGPGGASGPAPAITQLPRALSQAELGTIRAGNDFGFRLLRELTGEDPSASVFVSPFSASMALGMALNGAEGETWGEMAVALGLDGLEEEAINRSYRDLLDLLARLDPEVELTVGNSVWYREDLTLRPSFRERVEAHFAARIEGLDFGDPGAADVINGWVRSATGGRIEAIVPDPIPANIVAYLLNGVYFKAGWTEAFDPEATRSAPFHRPDGTTAPVELMIRDDTLRYAGSEGWDAVDLPYGGQAFAMTVVVPRGERGVHELIDELDAEGWDELVSELHETRAQVLLPRFELEWEAVLNDALRALGMERAFGAGADFGRMFADASPWIDEVRQKSFVRVDEEGTEAAAVTSVAMPTSMPPTVRADRPFLFAIRERLSGTILFLGAIVEPPTL